MDRSEVYPLVMISLFLVFYATLASSAIALDYTPTDIEQPELSNYTPILNNVAYPVKSAPLNESQEGQNYYNYTDEDGDLVPWTYDVSGYNDVSCSINDYGDGFRLYLSKQDEGAWFPWDKSEVTLYDDDLYDKIQLPSDVQITFKINLEKTFDLTIVAYDGETLTESFMNKHFSIILGENTANVTQEEISSFNAFLQLVSFNIPDIDPAISFLIATPIYVLGAYLIVRVVLMFLPFVSGGA
jgi:hypothetical protein